MALVICTGFVLAATLTPLVRPGEPNGSAVGRCDLSRIGLPSTEDIARSGATDIAPNILLFVPLGLAIGLVPASRQRLTFLIVAGAAPILIELTQLLVPALARGCESADVVDNLTGLAIGYAVISVLVGLHVVVRGDPQQSATDDGEPLVGGK